MDSVKTNEGELTSTMGNLLSTSKDEKNDGSDSTPTSSTDAFTTTSTSQIAADDPISSTSSDILDSKRNTEKANDVSQSATKHVNTSPIISSIRNISIGDHTSIVSEKDLLDMNITDTSTEKITENVDDIVQDLENLLGEPTTTFDFTIRRKDIKREIRTVSNDKDISMDLDDFSVDFQMPEEKPNEATFEKVCVGVGQITNKGDAEVVKTDIPKVLEGSSVTTPDINKPQSIISDAQIQDQIEPVQDDSNFIEKFISNETMAETNKLQETATQHEDDSKSSNSTPKLSKENEVSMADDITSTHSKETGGQETSDLTNCQNITENISRKDEQEENPGKIGSENIIKNESTLEEKSNNLNESLLDLSTCQNTVTDQVSVSATISHLSQDLSRTEKEKQAYEENFSDSNISEPVLLKTDEKNVSDLIISNPLDVIVIEKQNQNQDESTDMTIEHTPCSNETDSQQCDDILNEKSAQVEKGENHEIETCDNKEIDIDQFNSQAISETETGNNFGDNVDHGDNPEVIVNEEIKCITENVPIALKEAATSSGLENEQNAFTKEAVQTPTESELISNSDVEMHSFVEEGNASTDLNINLSEEPKSNVSAGNIALEADTFEEGMEILTVHQSNQGENQEHNVPDVVAVDDFKVLKENVVDHTKVQMCSSLKEPNILKEDAVDENMEVSLKECSLVDNVNIPSNNLVDSVLSNNIEPLSTVPVDILRDNIMDNLGVVSVEPVEDLKNLTENIVDELITPPTDHIEPSRDLVQSLGNDNVDNNEENVDVSQSSSINNIENLEESVIENSILPLVMEDVPDLDVLNAISTLGDSKTDVIPEIGDNLGNNDTLLSSNSLSSQEQPSDAAPFESALPTVDDIFAEQNDQQPVELQDDNLETLLAVASLQSVCESDPVYNITQVEDISDFGHEGSELKDQNEKIETLFGQKEEIPELPIEVQSEELQKMSVDNSKTKTVEKTEYQEDKLKEPLIINIEDAEKDRTYSPKITIKPIKSEEVTSASGEVDEKEGSKGSLKMTITKQSDTMHSILKIYNPEDDISQQQIQDLQHEPTVPKLIIKPIVQPNEQPQSPKMSTRSSKQVFSPTSTGNQRSSSPRITIKPIIKPENVLESVSPLKITIKPVLKPEESHRQKHSPKLTIKPIMKPDEDATSETKVHSPRVTIKPIIKPPEELDQSPSPRITIKPIVKPDVVLEPIPSTPRVTIKPVIKPSDKEKNAETPEQPVERSSPKITIKPIVKPQEPEPQIEDFEESVKERIVLKINKGTIPSSSKELRKRDVPQEEEKSEKLAKIKLKFSKEGGHPHIVQDESHNKRPLEQLDHDKSKRQKVESDNILPGVTITPIGPPHSKLKEMLSKGHFAGDKILSVEDDDDDVTIVEDSILNKPSPIVISEESNQESINVAMEVRDPISEIPVFEITPDSVKTINPQPAPPVVEVPVPLPAPRKRGRPRKVPLQVREDFKDPKEEEPKPVIESTRPKRSCRGQSVRTTLGIKPRKPRGPGRGRGSKRGMGTRSTPTPPETPPKPAKEPKLSAAKLKQLKEGLLLLSDKTEVKQIEIDDGFLKSPSQSVLAPPHSDNSTTDRADIVMYEEETRMSAETSSRAQTPAKQVVSSVPSVDLVEESQSSVQSTATTESVKVRKGPRLEVHQEPEGAVISADQLAEYYWSGGGPYMLQEQVAQFLGIKSFKRKYPNIPRRFVDMQERDFIRESGLAGEAMCDLGLTAVNSTDILDIMYSDFQDKYEEYCKHQRDRQAKDLTNKQKALSLAASQEKTKMDITQQAVQSAATWNANFNKTRRDQRKACMDLQTLTVHFPKGKMKQISKPKIGFYPVALVPGQFTDYYKEFTPTEINNLPFNTLCYDPITKGTLQEMECDSQTDGSGSESDSTTSDSDSSYSGSSDGEDCTLCKPSLKRVAAAQ